MQLKKLDRNLFVISLQLYKNDHVGKDGADEGHHDGLVNCEEATSSKWSFSSKSFQ